MRPPSDEAAIANAAKVDIFRSAAETFQYGQRKKIHDAYMVGYRLYTLYYCITVFTDTLPVYVRPSDPLSDSLSFQQSLTQSDYSRH